MRAFVALLLVIALFVPGAVPAHADAYHATPKLVVVLVIDQFRGDYLDRYRDDFKTPNGFNLFLKKGVHFTDCYYDYANLVTAAGHSTIGTGRQPPPWAMNWSWRRRDEQRCSASRSRIVRQF